VNARAAAAATAATALLLAACAPMPSAPARAPAAPPAPVAMAPATPEVAAVPATPPAAPLGIRWYWVRTVDPERNWTPASPGRYVLELTPAGEARVLADCNRGTGRYALEGRALSVGPLATTRMACPAGSLDARFLAQLAAVRGQAVVAGLLRLDLLADGGTMFFAREPDARVVEYRCAGGAQPWAVYTAGRARLAVGPDVLDLAAAESASGARYAAGTTTWFTKGDEAFLERAGGSGVGGLRRLLDDCRAAPPTGSPQPAP
jgi:membrane-bound inhibitor of C-type lysozyme